MSNDNTKYLVDTDVTIHIGQREDSIDIYDGVFELASAGRVKAVRQLFGELKVHPPTQKIVMPHRNVLELANGEQYSQEVASLVEYLGNNAGYLWEQTGGKNPDPADPWLIAAASALGYIVVTDESPLSPKKIPAACKLPEISCKSIRGPHFLFQVGIVKEIDPAHIDPALFFKSK